MNPCKKCVVRAACSEDCKEFHKYADTIAAIVMMVSVVIAGGFTIYTLYLFGGSLDPIPEAAQIKLVVYWLSCGVASLFINIWTDEKIHEFVIFIFGPFIFYLFIMIYITSFLMRRNIRKRV